MSNNLNEDLMKKSSINAILGKYYGKKLYNLLNDCCTGVGSFCYEVKTTCLGIFDGGNSNKFLNQKGEWALISNAGSLITLTLLEAQALIVTNEVIPGQLYKIENFDSPLYGGTTVYVKGATTSSFETRGYGEFYNPDYKNIPMFDFWLQVDSFTDPSNGNSPIFEIDEPLTGDNGALGFYRGGGLIEYESGDWSTATTAEGINSGAILGIVATNPNPINIGDKRCYGGKVWENTSGSYGVIVDIFTLDPNSWVEVPFNTTDYVLVLDEIELLVETDLILGREDKTRGLKVTFCSATLSELDSFNIPNPIKAFKWGSDDMFDCNIDNSYFFCVNNINCNVAKCNFEQLTIATSFQKNGNLSLSAIQSNLSIVGLGLGVYTSSMSNGQYSFSCFLSTFQSIDCSEECDILIEGFYNYFRRLNIRGTDIVIPTFNLTFTRGDINRLDMSGDYSGSVGGSIVDTDFKNVYFGYIKGNQFDINDSYIEEGEFEYINTSVNSFQLEYCKSFYDYFSEIESNISLSVVTSFGNNFYNFISDTLSLSYSVVNSSSFTGGQQVQINSCNSCNYISLFNNSGCSVALNYATIDNLDISNNENLQIDSNGANYNNSGLNGIDGVSSVLYLNNTNFENGTLQGTLDGNLTIEKCFIRSTVQLVDAYGTLKKSTIESNISLENLGGQSAEQIYVLLPNSWLLQSIDFTAQPKLLQTGVKTIVADNVGLVPYLTVMEAGVLVTYPL